MSKKLLDHFHSERLSVEERIIAGKELRNKFPRINQGEYKPADNRVDPVSVLEEQAKTRLAELIPVRYARMLTSPFAFLRGGAAVMAAELAAWLVNLPESLFRHVATCIWQKAYSQSQPSASMILMRHCRKPWEWDLKRLVASIERAG